MAKTKIIKNNNKAKYMIIATILSGLLLLIFGICMSISPIINYSNSNGDIFANLRNFYTRELTSAEDIVANDLEAWFQLNWLPFLALSNDNEVVFLPTKLTVIWIPIFLGLVSILIMTFRMIIHTIGYRTVNKKGITRIVKPIRSYQLTLSLSWTFITLIVFFGLISLITIYPFTAGAFITLDLRGNIIINLGNVNDQFWDIELLLTQTGVNDKLYWLTMLSFQGNNLDNGLYYAGSAIATNSMGKLALWFILPLLPLTIIITNNLVGTICGACSWGSINETVYKNLQNEWKSQNVLEKQERVEHNTIEMIEEKKDKTTNTTTTIVPLKIDSGELKNKCLKFYDKLAEMLRNADTTYSPLFALADSKINLYKTESKKIDWKVESSKIEDVIADITQKDVKFIMLIEKILKNPRIEIFGSDKFELMSLIQAYDSAYTSWDIKELESVIEKIYLIAFNYKEFYGKVGYCIRTKLLNNYKKFTERTDLLTYLNQAKENEDYETYRQVCIEAIEEISSNKVNFSALVNRYIHN